MDAVTPDELRALADDLEALLELSCEQIADLARLCAEATESLEVFRGNECMWCERLGVECGRCYVAGTVLAKLSELGTP